MKAVRFYGIGNVQCDNIDLPAITKDDVLIKVAYAGICGSDKHIFNKGMFVENIPETMGHEFVGTIAAIGNNVKNLTIGDKVTANPMIYCKKCPACTQKMYNACENLTFIGESRAGCFAEYISLNQEKIIKLPSDADLKNTVLAEPLAVAVHTLKRAQINPDDKLAIIGAGPIGSLITAVARNIYDIKDITVIDLSEERLNLLHNINDDINIKTEFNNDLYNVIIDAAGSNHAFNEALNHLYADSSIYVVSLSEKKHVTDLNILVNKQLKIIGCNCYDHVDVISAIDYLNSKKLSLDFLVTAEFALTQCTAAFELLMQTDKLVEKIVFKI